MKAFILLIIGLLLGGVIGYDVGYNAQSTQDDTGDVYVDQDTENYYWESWQRVDPVDTTESTGLIHSAIYRGDSLDSNPNLSIRCRDEELNIYINWKTVVGFIGAEQHIVGSGVDELTARIGEARPQVLSSTGSIDGEATFIKESQQQLRKLLLRYARSKDTRLRVRIRAVDGALHYTEFDLAGMTEALEPVREACNF